MKGLRRRTRLRAFHRSAGQGQEKLPSHPPHVHHPKQKHPGCVFGRILSTPRGCVALLLLNDWIVSFLRSKLEKNFLMKNKSINYKKWIRTFIHMCICIFIHYIYAYIIYIFKFTKLNIHQTWKTAKKKKMNLVISGTQRACNETCLCWRQPGSDKWALAAFADGEGAHLHRLNGIQWPYTFRHSGTFTHPGRMC